MHNAIVSMCINYLAKLSVCSVDLFKREMGKKRIRFYIKKWSLHAHLSQKKKSLSRSGRRHDF